MANWNKAELEKCLLIRDLVYGIYQLTIHQEHMFVLVVCWHQSRKHSPFFRRVVKLFEAGKACKIATNVSNMGNLLKRLCRSIPGQMLFYMNIITSSITFPADI